MTGADVRASAIRALRSTGETLAPGAMAYKVEGGIVRAYHTGAAGVRTLILECDTHMASATTVRALVDSCIHEIEAARASEDAAQLSLLPPRGLGR